MNFKPYSILIFTFIISFSLCYKSSDLINYAKQYIGVPYCWGGETPECFDCSGFVQYVYKHALGINIDRTVAELINNGREVSRDELKPGDLVFPSDHHVTLYIGNNEIIHAPHTGEFVKIQEIYSFWRARRIVDFEDGPVTTFESVFDAEFYSYKYDDLKDAFGTDHDKLLNHFYSFGIKEGRAASPAFDVTYYLEHNPDLKKAFGTDNEAAFNHFVSLGSKENRDLSPVFHLGYYKENNPDVVELFGADNPDGIMHHFLVYGLDEGRVSSPNFEVRNYKMNNKDLEKKFGNNFKKYYYYYCKYGEKS